MVDSLDPVALWRTYGRHAETMLAAGPAPFTSHRSGSFIALSGAPHVDLNQAVIYGDGGRDDAQAAVDSATSAAVPCLLGVSSTVREDVSATLADGGFSRMPEREALFHATVAPTPRPTVFDVREVVTDRDFAGIGTVFAGAHDYDPSLVATMWGPRLLGPCRARGWLAWDAAEPVSCVFVTRVGSSLGVFDMLTSARHRRRGAARALLARALTEVAHGESTDSIAFWASPAGRPLYESMGFAIADSVHVWTLGASPEDLAAVGAG